MRSCLWNNKNNELSSSLHGSKNISQPTKIFTQLMPAIRELSVSIYLSMSRTKANLVWGGFWLTCEHRGIVVGYLNEWWCPPLTMMVQTWAKCKLNNTELFLKLFYIQSKEIGNRKYYEETKKLEKWQSENSPEYWR